MLLTGGEVDTIAGLLTLREGQAFRLWATAIVLERLDANPIFEVVSRALVPRLALPLQATQRLTAPDHAALLATAIPVPGKVPLYAEDETQGAADGETIGLLLEAEGARLLFVPGCAAMTPLLASVAASVDCVVFEGTLWEDDEMIGAGLGTKTGRRMGHMSVAGPGGVLEQFRTLCRHTESIDPHETTRTRCCLRTRPSGGGWRTRAGPPRMTAWRSGCERAEPR